MDKNDDILMDGIDERIEAFLRGDMTAEEEVAFKKEIRENPVLRNRSKTMVSLIRGIQKKHGEEEETIISKNEANYSEVQACQTISVLEDSPASRNYKKSSILLWACSVAAIFVVSFGIYKEYRFRMLNSTVSPYYTEYDMSDISRGDVDSTSVAHLYNLFIQIQEKRNMSALIKELEPIYHSLDDDFTYNAYANDIAWNLALAYIKDNKIDKAIVILQKLKANNPDTPIFNKADELIKKLQDI